MIAASLIKEDNSPDLPRGPIILDPYYLDQRMVMQNSRFMVWGTDKTALDDIVEKENYMELPDESQAWREYGSKQEKQFAFCVRVNSSQKHQLIRELEIMGISEKSLFPGLEGIGRFLERHYRYSYGEALL